MRTYRLTTLTSLVVAAALLVSSGATVAQAGPLLRPLAQTGILYDQLQVRGSNAINSQNFEPGNDNKDDMAADDFTVPASATWGIFTVEVVGSYFPSSPTPTGSLNLTFYNDSGGLPGSVVTTTTVATTTVPPLFESSGSFVLGLSSAITLTGAPGTGTKYWISVQASRNLSDFFWLWQESGTSNGSSYVWQNPGGGQGAGCTSWTNHTSCISPPTNNDLMFRLSSSAATPDPTVISLDPSHMGPGSPAFELFVIGTGFKINSTVYWNGTPRNTTFDTATSLKADISAGDVASYGTAQVKVVNVPPCLGDCESNELTFFIQNSLFFPLLARNP